MSIIALMTDFGTRDHYVAAMKGVILHINPKVMLLDITHEVPAQDVLHGAFVLRQVVPYLPSETIVVAVVDPTVGTSRHVLAARYNNRIVLAPDNGLLTLLHRDANLQEIRVVENRRFFAGELSRTFHGRDIFAPVAAHISRGLSLDHLGPVADRIEVLDLAPSRISPEGINGEVLLVDHFGNLITNISALDLSAARVPRRHFEVLAGPHAVGPIRNTYSEVPVGQPLALVGSTQMLEVAVNRGNAAQKLGLGPGAPVCLR